MFRLKLRTVIRPVVKGTRAGTVTVNLLYKRKFCHFLSLHILCSYTTRDNRSVPTIGTHTVLLTFYKFNRNWVSLSLLFAIILHLTGTDCYKNIHYLIVPKKILIISDIVNGSTAQACIIIINNYTFNSLNAELNPICRLLALLGAHHILHTSRVRVNKFVQFWNLYVCTDYENLRSVHRE